MAVLKRLGNERGRKRMARLVQEDSKVTETWITTRCNSGMQRSISGHTCLTLKWEGHNNRWPVSLKNKANKYPIKWSLSVWQAYMFTNTKKHLTLRSWGCKTTYMKKKYQINYSLFMSLWKQYTTNWMIKGEATCFVLCILARHVHGRVLSPFSTWVMMGPDVTVATSLTDVPCAEWTSLFLLLLLFAEQFCVQK